MPSRNKLTPEEEIIKAGPRNHYRMEKCAADCKVSLPNFYRTYVHSGLLKTARLPDGMVVTTPHFLLLAHLAVCGAKERAAKEASDERQRQIKELKKAAKV